MLGPLGGLELVQEGKQLLAPGLHVSSDVVLLENLLGSDAGSTGDSVSCVCSAHRALVERAHNLLRGNDTGKWETVCHSFGEDHNVGSQSLGSLDGEVGSRPEETGLDLIDNKQDVVLVADLSEVSHERRWAWYVTTVVYISTTRLD